MAISDEQQAKADPELIQQLEDAAPDSLVDAVFMLDASDGLRPAEVVEESVRGLLSRAESTTGIKVSEFTIFPNLASFVVRAGPQLVEEIIDQPEVGSAVANQQPGSASA